MIRARRQWMGPIVTRGLRRATSASFVSSTSYSSSSSLSMTLLKGNKGKYWKNRIINQHFSPRCYYSPSTLSCPSITPSTVASTSNCHLQQRKQKQPQRRRNLSSSSSSSISLPDKANVIIIGGGIIGTSVAYHLAKLGVENVILVEQHRLTSGTTWHAAGLMTSFGSLSSTSMEMRLYTRDLYQNILPDETGLETGFQQIGFIELASGQTYGEAKDRLHYLRRVAAFNRHCGIEVEEITPQRVQELFPLLHIPNNNDNSNNNDDIVLAGFYVPHDGRVNPTDATMALAKGARYPQNSSSSSSSSSSSPSPSPSPNEGVQIFEHVRVENVTTSSTVQTGQPRRVTGVEVVQVDANTATTSNDEKRSIDNGTNTSTHFIKANTVVNCTGMWARQLGQLSDVTIPNQAAEHYYLITEDIPTEFLPSDGNINNVDFRSWPVIEDPSRCIYVRPEGKGLLIGFFEWDGASWRNDAATNNNNDNGDFIPHDFAFGELEPDWDRMAPYIERAMNDRLSYELIQSLGIKKLFCGPESFTPDNRPIVGPAPSLQNYYVAAGLNSVGILTGGGIGKTLAQWIHNDGISPTSIDVTPIHANRFHKYQGNTTYRHGRVGESLGNTYRLLYPDHQPRTCRGAKKSPLHDRLVNNNGREVPHFRDVSGWESPSWYATKTSTAGKVVVEEEEEGTFGKPNFFNHWRAEHIACRESVALFDMSFMSKFLIQGYDAGKFLNYLSTANITTKNRNNNNNQITYTQWLNEYGYLEADVTIIQRTEDSFIVVATDTMHHHVYGHMMKRLTSNTRNNDMNWHVTITDVTSSYAQINLQGPNSRRLLHALTPTSMNMMDDDYFPFRAANDIEIGMFGRVLCCRITYVGELGYELFIPAEQATYVYDTIIETAAKLQMDDDTFYLKHAGLKALGSLRLEKGYRDYGHDIDNTDTVIDAGLSFTCDFNKEGGFIGMEQTLAQKALIKERGNLYDKRMANVFVPSLLSNDDDNDGRKGGNDDVLLYHGEVLWRNGQRISDLRAASYGFTVGGGIGLSMLTSPPEEVSAKAKTTTTTMDGTKNPPPVINKKWIEEGEWELEVADKRYPCEVSLSSFYDPKNTKIRV